MLSYLEYRTAAIYHATRDILVRLDAIQTRFLQDAGIDELTALMQFNLAPLSTRRDIAMLGLLHRVTLGKGPPHFRRICPPGEGRTLKDPRVMIKHPLVRRSLLGLVAVYNRLSKDIRGERTVAGFQGKLQNLLKRRCEDGNVEWPLAFCPRQGT